MAQILIVEDDSVINSLIYEFLTDNGHLCRQAFSGTEGKLLADMETFDLILLDLMIPGMKGDVYPFTYPNPGDCTLCPVCSGRQGRLR